MKEWWEKYRSDVIWILLIAAITLAAAVMQFFGE